MATFTSIDDYVASFPDGPREILEQVRDAMRRGAPGSEEKIRYGMPAVMFGHRYGMHYAGWKKHIGLYPVPVFDEPLESEVAGYRSGKDSVNLPHNKPLPDELITQIAVATAAKRPS